MINPIVIIIASAILLSVLVVRILNRPKKPIITGALILILIFFIIATWLIDNAISSFNSTRQFMDFVSFIVMIDNPTYTQLENSFTTFMITDIVLFAVLLISFFFEILYILKNDKDYRVTK